VLFMLTGGSKLHSKNKPICDNYLLEASFLYFFVFDIENAL
jgi:hypothetical protein